MTTQLAPWPLRLLRQHPVMVGVPLTYASLAAAITIQTLTRIEMMPWGWLIFVVCFTPTFLCADYLGAWPGASVTLSNWFFLIMCYAVWAAQFYLPLPNIVLPWGGNRFVKSVVGCTGYMLALYLSQLCVAHFNRQSDAAVPSADGRD